ncbi:chemotaxis-specific protein-glutamate methyltransferase CheB [Parasphingopyxis sp. CP4]|uniref:chemotaxis-specific protein-glutamate methyltransferase CheB n=1 Tax=Parasphingopyxis sp. CP4 TaxID=2724527 RepID=UPI0015A45D6C|nr:chemotaxis-specific protein-glutamate methyltransferase CheB [Parasphingopyxis sp. CP4]QLC21615.1 chemotaxis-specific protein-glutamate methyltransferase CheB [Parasphingopyxis sp. CP4]
MASRPDHPASAERVRSDKRNVLIVDDSAVARLIMQRVISETEQFRVGGHAGSAEDALRQLQTKQVDLVVLDIEMPGMNGIEAIPHIIRQSNNTPILIVSSHAREGAESSVRAMAMGASDIALKPSGPDENAKFAETLQRKMIRLTEARRVHPIAGERVAKRAHVQPVPVKSFERPIQCLAIGASTGGIHALSQFFKELPRDVAVPIFVTQHLPADFIVYFARQLASISGRKAVPAFDGQLVTGDEIMIAPGDAHLTVEQIDGQLRVIFDHAPAPHGYCPSVDPMLSSVAQVYGEGAIGVVLTGMGRDGALGTAELAKLGGEILVQDPDSSVIWGMPGAVANQGIANLVAPPITIAQHIAERARNFGCS